MDIHGGVASRGFPDRCARLLWNCDRLRRLADYLIAYIHAGNRSMKIIFEAGTRVENVACLHSLQLGDECTDLCFSE